MDEKELDELLRMEGDNITAIKKTLNKEQQRREINARYYQKHREQILDHNAMKIWCKLCNVKINKGSYQLHKKSQKHKRILEVSHDLIDDSDDEE